MESSTLTSMYSVEPNPSEPPYPSVIRLSSDSSTSFTAGHAPPSVCGHGFIRTHVVPYRHGRGHARGRGRGDDAPGSFRIGYLPLDG